MPLRKYPRIEIDQRAYDALQAEGILQHRTTREIATEAILSHISTEAKSFIDRKTAIHEDIATKGPLDHKTTEDECGAATVADIPQKKKRLSENPDALRQIRTMWVQSPRPSLAKMSVQIGYHKATIHDAIQRMKKNGEIVE